MFKTIIFAGLVSLGSNAFAGPCTADAQKLCPGLAQKEAASCLMKHLKEISPECVNALGGAEKVNSVSKSQEKIDSIKKDVAEKVQKSKADSDTKKAEYEKQALERKQKREADRAKYLAERESKKKMTEDCKTSKQNMCGSLKKFSEKKKCWAEKATPECKKLVY